MTLGEIKSDVRTLMQDEDYDGDTIRMAANWFVYELANNNKLRIFEDSAELSANIGDTTLDMPDNQIWWAEIYVTAPSVYDFGSLFVEYPTFMKHNANFASATASKASQWTAYGNAMRFSAPLNAAHTFQFDFVREPEPMVSDSDDCEIPTRYAELMARGIKARLLEIDEDYEYASQERDLLDPLMTTFIRNESRGGGKTRPTIIRTNRRRNPYGGGTGIPRMGE